MRIVNHLLGPASCQPAEYPSPLVTVLQELNELGTAMVCGKGSPDGPGCIDLATLTDITQGTSGQTEVGCGTPSRP